MVALQGPWSAHGCGNRPNTLVSREGVSSRPAERRVRSKTPIRYVALHPNARVHVDRDDEGTRPIRDRARFRGEVKLGIGPWVYPVLIVPRMCAGIGRNET